MTAPGSAMAISPSMAKEAETPPAQKESLLHAGSRDTVRSRSYTGKPCRMLRNDWTEAWEKPENPKPLGMPLQFMVTSEAVVRASRYASKAQEIAFNPVGQVVGRMKEVRPVRDVIYEHPLMIWRDVKGSKIRLRDFIIVGLDLCRIYLRYLRR